MASNFNCTSVAGGGRVGGGGGIGNADDQIADVITSLVDLNDRKSCNARMSAATGDVVQQCVDLH